jgi:hypothetical protein
LCQSPASIAGIWIRDQEVTSSGIANWGGLKSGSTGEWFPRKEELHDWQLAKMRILLCLDTQYDNFATINGRKDGPHGWTKAPACIN